MSAASPRRSGTDLLPRCITGTDGNGDSLRLSYCSGDPHQRCASRLTVFLVAPDVRSRSFYYTDDQRIAVTGGTACLDQVAERPGSVQTWQCTSGDTHQAWTVTDAKATVTSTNALPGPTTVCEIGHQQILHPAAGTDVTQAVINLARFTGHGVLTGWATVPVGRDPVHVLLCPTLRVEHAEHHGALYGYGAPPLC
jgi:hypothetical protein